MPSRPTFIKDARLRDGDVRVRGTLADGDDPRDILDIWVVLAQKDRIASVRVEDLTSSWHVMLPVKDPDNDAQDFSPGPATAFGVEVHKTNFTTITWAESVKIKEA